MQLYRDFLYLCFMHILLLFLLKSIFFRSYEYLFIVFRNSYLECRLLFKLKLIAIQYHILDSLQACVSLICHILSYYLSLDLELYNDTMLMLLFYGRQVSLSVFISEILLCLHVSCDMYCITEWWYSTNLFSALWILNSHVDLLVWIIVPHIHSYLFKIKKTLILQKNVRDGFFFLVSLFFSQWKMVNNGTLKIWKK